MFIIDNVLKLPVSLYADETLILGDSPKNLQTSLLIFISFCEKWHLTVN